jgi:hypothetical protein
MDLLAKKPPSSYFLPDAASNTGVLPLGLRGYEVEKICFSTLNCFDFVLASYSCLGCTSMVCICAPLPVGCVLKLAYCEWGECLPRILMFSIIFLFESSFKCFISSNLPYFSKNCSMDTNPPPVLTTSLSDAI